MSPRDKIECECEYAECDQYFSTGRGFLQRTFICHRPGKEGSWCVLNAFVDGECDFTRAQKEQEAQEETEPEKAS